MDYTALGNWRVFRHHRLDVVKAGQDYSTYEDICTSVTSVDSTHVVATADRITWQTHWRFEHDSADDAMDIRRVLGISRDDDYVTVTYYFTWDSPEDSIRFTFRDRPRIQPDGSTHDVGYAPGYGEVRRDMRFDAGELGYWLGMAGVGNPLAEGDTLGDGSASYESDYLRVDYGSGRRQFPVGFMCFNTTRDIYPAEIAWVDSEFLYIPSLHADSSRISTDTTSVYHSKQRWLYWRTPFVHFRQGETKTLEYAIGRGERQDGDYLFPDVVFQNGTTSSCPDTPKR
jgi:hypothetical protein